MYFKIGNQPHKLFFFAKLTKHFPLMIPYRYNAFPFCAKYFLVLWYDFYCILRFLHFLSFLVYFLCFNCVIVNEEIKQLLLYFFFVEPLCLPGVFRTSPQLKTKTNQYTINLKYPLKTKMQLRWAQSASFSTWLRVVKVLYHKHFWKLFFRSTSSVKKS